MKRIVVATRNPGKLREIREALAGLPVELVAADEIPGAPEVEELGETFFDNAAQKALALARHSGLPALADDSGLEVEALGGAPGVYSARYAGPECDFDKNMRKVLEELQGVPDDKRAARFVCVIALCRPGHEPQAFHGECPGRIGHERRGRGGFGYDPIFFMQGQDKTFAELTPEEKNTISHRALATKACRKELERLLALGQ